MAANTNPIFPLTGHDGGIAVALLTSDVATGTSAAAVYTASADGGRLTHLSFTPAEPIGTGGWIHIYYYNGTSNILMKNIKLPEPWAMDNTIVWAVPAPDHIINGTRLIKAGKTGTAGVIHCYPYASDYV